MSPRPARLEAADRGPDAPDATDKFGHLGPKAPGAYSVHRLSLAQTALLRDTAGAHGRC
jgi:hypothetical protein